MNRIHRSLIVTSLAFFACFLLASQPAKAITATAIAFDATHEIVCSCDCHGETQTFAWEQGLDCSTLNETPCTQEDGDEFALEGCTRKAQKKVRTAEPTGGMTVSPIASEVHDGPLQDETPAPVATPATSSAGTAIIARPIGPIPYPFLKSFNIPTGAQYLAWLDGISQNLFGMDFPGLIVNGTPSTTGAYTGFTAWPIQPFGLTVSSIQDSETIFGYVDPNSGMTFNLQVVWLTGTITAGAQSVTTGSVAVTATVASNPSQTLTGLYPLGANYPFAPSVSGATSAGLAPIGSVEFADEADEILGLPDFGAAVAEEGDPCTGCYTTANQDIERMKRDYKRCLKWGAAGAVVGGLVGAIGGPWTAAAGAVLGGAIVAGECSDEALDTYADIIEDFCACLAEHDCPAHEACD